MRIIQPGEFVAQPWKNGGGVTQEIARAEAPFWRLSIAEVSTDGPFSAFAGLTRILTVIEGAGIALHTPAGVQAATPLQPVRFSGDVPVLGRLCGGPIRDLNLIFDATRLEAAVTPLTGPERRELAADGLAMVLCLGGSVSMGAATVPRGAVAVMEGEGGVLALAAGALALLVLVRDIG